MLSKRSTKANAAWHSRVARIKLKTTPDCFRDVAFGFTLCYPSSRLITHKGQRTQSDLLFYSWSKIEEMTFILMLFSVSITIKRHAQPLSLYCCQLLIYFLNKKKRLNFWPSCLCFFYLLWFNEATNYNYILSQWTERVYKSLSCKLIVIVWVKALYLNDFWHLKR